MKKRKQTILVVDDEQDILDALFDTFSDNYYVLKAKSANAAMELLNNQNNKVDLIISDQRMPETTGSELFAKLEKDHAHIGKILLTGYSDLSAVVDAINKGSIDKYLTKPWDETQITHIVLEVLHKRLEKALEDRKIYESQLVHAAKMASLGELVAGIAHELNNPLGFIHANLGNLNKFFTKINGLIESYDLLNISSEAKDQISKNKADINFDYVKERVISMIDRSKIGAERMKKIILDLKTFSRLDASEVDEANINENIDTTLGIMTNEYKNRIEIVKAYGDIPAVCCYIAKINQVFMNILVNSCHAIEGIGEIKIRTYVEGAMVVIEISDTGKGIPENILENIFDPFFTTKPVGIGTGLGLSISHGIIKKHNGELFAASKEKVGTTFTIKLPVNADFEDN